MAGALALRRSGAQVLGCLGAKHMVLFTGSILNELMLVLTWQLVVWC
jgi:hypothetical protein